MREIKFRAWDGKTMTHDIGIVNNRAVDFTGEDIWFWHEPAIAIMQYTGLLDKNGTEIYEGDIVQRTVDKETQNHIICWGTWSWVKRLKPDSPAFAFDPIDARSNCEVIGNIYQNPNLFKRE